MCVMHIHVYGVLAKGSATLLKSCMENNLCTAKGSAQRSAEVRHVTTLDDVKLLSVNDLRSQPRFGKRSAGRFAG